jgi:hypothetical protein
MDPVAERDQVWAESGKKSKTKLWKVSWLSLKTKVEPVQGSGQFIESGKTE